MTLTDVEAVRLQSGDKSVITREEGEGDGAARFFKLGHANIFLTPAIEVRVSGVVQTTPAQYTLNNEQGVLEFVSAPPNDADLEFTYYWSQFSDAEVQYFIDSSAGDTTLATAKLLLAIAADASKVAQRQSLAGGGGLGAVTIDTSVAARELRNTAKALIDNVILVDSVTPAEGLTEVAWTEFQYLDSLAQRVIREN